MQNYTLGQIGVFVRECQESEKQKKHNSVLASWLGTHLNQKGIKNYFKKEQLSDSTDNKKLNKEPDKKEVDRSWKRLAMSLKKGFK